MAHRIRVTRGGGQRLRILFAVLLAVGFGCGDGGDDGDDGTSSPASSRGTANGTVGVSDGPNASAGPRASAGASPPEITAPVSIVLISIDTLRSDHVGAYGGPVATPHLDALAAEGVVFERAYSHVPMTLPSHLSMLSGLLPPSHGVRDNIGYRPATAQLPYVPRRLQDAGYATAAAVSAYVMQGAGGLAHGFDLYDDALDAGSPNGALADGTLDRRGAGGLQRPGHRTLAAVQPWLEEQQGVAAPFFLFLHFFEPHTPYAPPAPFAQRYGAASYAGEVAAADALVGEVVATLRRLGLYDRTAIAVVSDHGEGLGDHGEEEHGLLLYRESLQVPLILRLPLAASAGQRVPEPVGLVDVAPTLLQWAGLPVDGHSDGVSLLDVLAGASRPAIYAETFYPRLHFGWSELTSLVAGRHQFIQAPTATTSQAELYDVVADPAQRNDLSASERRLAATLRQQLADWVVDPEPPGVISEQERQALAALGYVGDGMQHADGAASRPHPKTRLLTVDDIKACLRHYQAGALAAAVDACSAASAAHPQALDVWEHLARSLLELGRRQEALDALERALNLAQGRAPHLAVAAASVWLEARRPEAALDLLQREIVLAPDEVSLRLYAARTLVLTGQLEVALQQAEELVQRRPDNADAVYLRGAIRMGSQDALGGEADLRRALELAPDHTAALSDLATLMAQQQRRDEARQLYRRLLQLRPGDPAAEDGLRRLEEKR